MPRHVLIAVLFSVSALVSPAVADVQVRPEHPRIYLRSDDVPALRQRVDSSLTVGRFYQQLKERADATSQRHRNDEVAGFELQALALCHVLEVPSPVYRDKAVLSWFRSSYESGSISHWDLPFCVIGQAIALDWMWDELTPMQRMAFGRALVAMMDDLESYAPHDIAPGRSGANQMSDYSNQLYYHLGSLAFAGAVLADEGIADEHARGYLTKARRLIVGHMIPAMNQEAGGEAEMTRASCFDGNGGWGEDMGHLSMTHPFFGRMLEAWRTSTGEDFFPQVNGLRTVGQYLYYLRRPGGRLAPKGNGTYDISLSDKHLGALGSLTSARYGDAFGKRIKDLSVANAIFGFHQVEPVLWYHDDLEDLKDRQLPRSMHFQGQGEVIVRSGFDRDATWVYLRSGPVYNGHQHDDQGNLLIEAYRGELFIEEAGNGQYATHHHNTLRVGGDQLRYGNNQVQHVQPISSTRFERGTITEFVHTEIYHYAAADMSNAYSEAAVPEPGRGRITRELVVILPDIVVVRDRVASPEDAEFLLHTWNRSGATTDLDHDAQTLRVIDGGGHGWAKTLLPQKAAMQHRKTGGTHRIAVRPSEPSKPDGVETFLHVFYLSPIDSVYIPTDVDLLTTDRQLGLTLSDRTGERWEVLFQANEVGSVEVRRTPSE